jgi:hypothetical protein
MTATLASGTRVRVVDVDEHGFTGRDKHPEPGDVGKLGTVQGNETWDAGEEYGGYVCYLVRMDDGRELRLIDFEVEPVFI